MAYSTADLLKDAVSGEDRAVTILLKRHAPELRRIIAAQLPRRWRSLLSEDDVLQQTFVDAIRDLPRFDTDANGSFLCWLKTLAQCNLRDAVRMLETNKRGGNHRRAESAAHSDAHVLLIELLGSADVTPSQEAAANECHALIRSAIQHLPSTHRLVVQQLDLEGRPVEHVARELNRSAGAVYMLRTRAHRMMREHLSATTDFFSDSA